MRRIWAVCAAIVLLTSLSAGCSHSPSPDQGQIKEAFVRQLVGFCAEVDRQLAKIDPKSQPGMAADQLAKFVSQARSQPAPDADRAQFDVMLTEMEAVVGHFRSAQTAMAADNQPAYKEALAQAVQQLGAAVLAGKIWVAGGLTSSTKATAATQIYDPASDAWEAGPSLPEAVDHAMLVTYRNQVVLIGGFVSRGGDSVPSAQVLFYDDSAGHWRKGPPLRHARAAGAAAVVGDKIVVVGGRLGSEQLVRETEIFDGKTWHDGTAIPVPGDHLAATSDRDYLYAVGGRRFTASNNTNVVQRYEPATNRWTTLAVLPERLSGTGAAVIGGQLLVVSGEDTTAVVPTVRALDLTAPTAAWTTVASLDQGRHGLAVAAVGDTLYAIGGSTRPGHTASTDTVNGLTFS